MTLHLNLKRKWFDMILSGEKKEEYRNITTYWNVRLFDNDGNSKPYDTVTFSNGYAKNRPQFKIKIISIKADMYCREEWGAVFGRPYYVIKLGDIIL